MALTTAEVKKLMQACFPQGSEQLYDWDNSSAHIGQFFTAIAGVWKTYGTDILDTLRLEINPLTCTQSIPTWESALGLANSPLAQFGTTVQRRNQILSWLRQSGTHSLDDIRSIVQPYFLYADASQIQIIETSRTDLTLLHTYSNTTALPILPNSSGSSTITVLDDPRTSKAGAVLTFTVNPATVDQIRVVLDGPDGTRAAWRGDLYLGTGAVGPATYILRAPAFSGKPIRGTWTLSFTTGAGAFTLSNWALTPVEGIGVNLDSAVPPNRNGEGLGAAMFEFAVVADESKLGTGYDLRGALRALRRQKPAHTQCTIVWRETGAADTCAIPDLRNATPDAAIPCS